MKSKKITKTMNQEENIFDKLSNDWWKIDGSFSALHAFNFVRIKFIKDVLGKKKSKCETISTFGHNLFVDCFKIQRDISTRN